MPADEDVLTIWRRWRQYANQFRRARLDAFLQSGRQRSSNNQLPLESRRKSIPLGESGRQMTAMVFVPIPHGITVVITVEIVPVIVVFVAMVFVVSTAVSVAVIVGNPRRRREREKCH